MIVRFIVTSMGKEYGFIDTIPYRNDFVIVGSNIPAVKSYLNPDFYDRDHIPMVVPMEFENSNGETVIEYVLSGGRSLGIDWGRLIKKTN